MYSRMDQVKVFKGCLPQILLGPFLNTVTQLILQFQNLHRKMIKTFAYDNVSFLRRTSFSDKFVKSWKCHGDL